MNELFEIRFFSDSDATRLAEIFNVAFRDELDRGMRALTPESFINSSKRPDVKILIAEDAGNVVGFLSLTEGSMEAPAQIHLLAVKEEHRGRGIGKELMKAALQHVRATGLRKLKLFTRPWNTAMSKICIDLGLVPEAYLRREYLDADLVLYSVFFDSLTSSGMR